MSDTNYKDGYAFERLPAAFWAAFYGELCAVAAMDILQVDPDCESMRAIDYYSGTSGWNCALWSTCKRLGLMDFYNWYEGLRWYESDEFDYQLSEELVKRIGYMAPLNSDTRHDYYMWLFEQKEKEDSNEELEDE